MILGLDISTSITGYTVLNYEGNILVCDHIDLRKEKNFFKKVRIINSRLETVHDTYEIEQVYIEQSLQSFRSGFSSAQTLSLLSKINGIVSWICYNMFGHDPKYLAATSARKACGIKVPRGQKAKAVSLQFVVDSVPGFDVQYTRHGNPKAGYADRSDSYVIAKAGWVREREEAQITD
jgi:Holliday junction resolvasome RuvABC endonuclease subunit|tara:strand:+ start:3463 stop:3996 length:534 start_codon:yes stop_codon:yes gene_type:complete